MNKKIFLPLITIMSFLLMTGAVNALGFQNLTLFNVTGDTTNTAPNFLMYMNHPTNTTGTCVLYFDGVSRASKTVANNTNTTFVPTGLGYDSYGVVLTCTEVGSSAPLSNSTTAITMNIHEIDCSGVERTIAGILIAMFMIGIIVFVAFAFVSGNVDVKVIIGAVVAILLLVIVLAILNPLITGLCG